MDFVDRHGGLKSLSLLAHGHPFLIVPLIAVEIPNYGGRVGAHFRTQSKGIRLGRDVPLISRLDFELVNSPLLQPRDEDLPKARQTARPHRVAAAVPLVEISDDTDTLGIRSPHRKRYAFRTCVLDQARAELFVQPEVSAFPNQVQVKIGENGWIAVGILDFVAPLGSLVRARQADGKPVREELGFIAKDSFEEAVRMDELHRMKFVPANHRDFESLRLEGSDDECRSASLRQWMHAEDIKGCAVVTADDGRHRAGISSGRIEIFSRWLRRDPTGSGFCNTTGRRRGLRRALWILKRLDFCHESTSFPSAAYPWAETRGYGVVAV